MIPNNLDSGMDFMNRYHDNDTVSDYEKLLRTEFNEHYIEHGSPIRNTDDQLKDNKFYDKLKLASDASQAANRTSFKTSDVKTSVKEINELYNDDLIVPAEDMLLNRFNSFARYGSLDPSGELVTGTREYLFFSKPDLNLVNLSNNISINPQLSASPFFNEAFNRYKLSYYALQQTYSASNKDNGKISFKDGLIVDARTKYIPLLSNMVTSTLDLPDITAGDVLNNQNLYQVNTSYREGSIVSDLQYDFSLEFKDTKYLDTFMLFKIYDEYHRYKYNVEITPVKMSYIFNKIYPEAISIWKLIVDDTGRIIYWAKAIGCTPMSVPRGSMSNIEGNIKFTINWKAQFIRDMDPVNLMELNCLTANSLGMEYNNTFEYDIIGSFMTDDQVNYISREERHNPNVNGKIMGNNQISMFNGPTWVGYPYIIMNSPRNPLRTGQVSRSDSNFHRLIWINE